MNNAASRLLKKYNVPVPRYTSYPTVPCWDKQSFSTEHWRDQVKIAFDNTNTTEGVSIYIHLPFCESLCTYCACNTRITVNHNVEVPYIQAVLKEWEGYKKVFGTKPIIRELHLGGGTPTFFSARNLQWMLSDILEDAVLHPDFQMSFEGHPNNTTELHLETLFKLGFCRVSFGVQDLDEKVQQTIHRIQPLENLERVTRAARDIGYESVSFDLIYGLPFQTPFSISDTIDKVLLLRPDRVSFYSYAHVPWLKPGQRGYEDGDLPSVFLKRHLYEIGRHKLRNAGYADIGMDHFALPGDALFKAAIAGKLHRNFMGYTTSSTTLLIGLGASAISDAGGAYAQNEKNVEQYRDAILRDALAIASGHVMTSDDHNIRRCILEISCRKKLARELLDGVLDETLSLALTEMEAEGILYVNEDGLAVTALGEPFIRNICRLFDRRMDLMEKKDQFSRAV